MKSVAMSAILLIGAVSSFGVPWGHPCWSGSNDCGNTRACKTIPQGPAGTQPVLCVHVFCDKYVECTSNSAITMYRSTTRNVYSWTDTSGNAHTCVGPPTTSNSDYCCQCSNVGRVISPGGGIGGSGGGGTAGGTTTGGLGG